MDKWIYERDYKDTQQMCFVVEYWMQCGYRVFVQGYSAMDAWGVR